MASGEELQNRLTDFAVGVMDLCDQLPKTFFRATSQRAAFPIRYRVRG